MQHADSGHPFGVVSRQFEIPNRQLGANRAALP